MTDAPTVAPCSRDAAKFAVEHWHYTQTMPSGKLVTHGVWERDRYIGAIVYGRGATPNLGRRYDLTMTEVCELVRIAFRDHQTPVSQSLAASLRLLADSNPGLRCVFSFADTAQGHHGGIYQATNWLYLGHTGTEADTAPHPTQAPLRIPTRPTHQTPPHPTIIQLPTPRPKSRR